MDWIIDNWTVIVAILCMIACVVESVITFCLSPNSKKIATVKEWLLYAVTEAEKQFGEKTGTLKLHYVYDLAIARFPWLSKMISFDTFSEWVDEALEWLRVQLSSNTAVQNYVEGESDGV